MALLFVQTITQFAPLRTFARIDYTNAQYSQLIRELFPKALFDEQNVSYNVFIEIAWSFLSAAMVEDNNKKWYINQKQQHRIGGLPAIFYADGAQEWYKYGKHHRDDKDPRTGLTLPATIEERHAFWFKDEKRHRDDKDPRTGLILPAAVYTNGSRYWYKDGNQHREDKDPRTGLIFPAIIYTDGSQYWYKNGYWHRDEKDPKTGLTLPAIVRRDGSQEWFKDGLHHRDDKDLDTGLTLPAIINEHGLQYWFISGVQITQSI